MNTRLRNTGFAAFFFSGICAISSGIVVSLLQQKYGFNYAVTGTLLSLMGIGNMLAAFIAGFWPRKIGMRLTILIMSCGYAVGYFVMTLTGVVGALMVMFFLVGIAKGSVLNCCSVLVGQNSTDSVKGMNIMHACYATGALACPFIIMALTCISIDAPMIGISVCGICLWILFFMAKLPGKDSAAPKGKSEGQSDAGNAVTDDAKSKAGAGEQKAASEKAFFKDGIFWLLTFMIFCQNAAETSVNGWMVTYYKDQSILSGTLSNYTVTVMWAATLIGRLLIAFVLPIRNNYKALLIMGMGSTVCYGFLVNASSPWPAIITLSLFAFSMAGVNPMSTGLVGKNLSPECMGVLLPIGSLGAIIMPWIIGIVSDNVGLKMGMCMNLIPCVGLLIISSVLLIKSDKAPGVSK